MGSTKIQQDRRRQKSMFRQYPTSVSSFYRLSIKLLKLYLLKMSQLRRHCLQIWKSWKRKTIPCKSLESSKHLLTNSSRLQQRWHLRAALCRHTHPYSKPLMTLEGSRCCSYLGLRSCRMTTVDHWMLTIKLIQSRQYPLQSSNRMRTWNTVCQNSLVITIISYGVASATAKLLCCNWVLLRKIAPLSIGLHRYIVQFQTCSKRIWLSNQGRFSWGRLLRKALGAN